MVSNPIKIQDTKKKSFHNKRICNKNKIYNVEKVLLLIERQREKVKVSEVTDFRITMGHPDLPNSRLIHNSELSPARKKKLF